MDWQVGILLARCLAGISLSMTSLISLPQPCSPWVAMPTDSLASSRSDSRAPPTTAAPLRAAQMATAGVAPPRTMTETRSTAFALRLVGVTFCCLTETHPVTSQLPFLRIGVPTRILGSWHGRGTEIMTNAKHQQPAEPECQACSGLSVNDLYPFSLSLSL